MWGKGGDVQRMTKAKNREAYYIAWKKENELLYGAYQCRADPDLFDKLDASIKTTNAVLFEISERMESEGTWKKKERDQ